MKHSYDDAQDRYARAANDPRIIRVRAAPNLAIRLDRPYIADRSLGIGDVYLVAEGFSWSNRGVASCGDEVKLV